LFKYEQEKLKLEEKLEQTRQALAEEETYYKALVDSKAKLDDEYTAKFKKNIIEQNKSLDTLIQKYREVASAAREAQRVMSG
jgi:predicted  nucleic acid-binding Zn-ribbon protein